MRPVLFVWGVVPALALWPALASAVGTRTFELDSLEKLSGGDLKGVAVGSDGVVRAGWNLGEVPLPDGSSSWATLRLADGSYLVGVSGGTVFRVTETGAAVYATMEAQAVTSLAAGPGGAVYAGTIPEAKIFKVTSGHAEAFATLPDAHHIWALATDKARSVLYAATGSEGRIYRVAPDGTPSVYLHTDEPNLVSMATAPNGDLLVGSSTRGLLYRVTGPGRASVIYDFPGDTSTEVRAIAVSGADIFVLVNEYTDAPEPPKRTAGEARRHAGPAGGSHPKPGKGWLYRFDADGRPEKLMHHDDFHYMSLAVDDRGAPFVGTGAEGRVYTVDEAHRVALVADTDERQVGALLVAGSYAQGTIRGILASSDPAVAHLVLGRGGADAVWTSKPLDAGLRAKFGRMTWQATGALEVMSRAGDTQLPDTTWSPWSEPLAAGAVIQSPRGRYLQVRARWTGDPRVELSDVVIPFVTENLRAVVTEISVQPKGAHEAKEGLAPSGGEPPKHESQIKVTFHVDNPDGDELRFRVSYRKDGDAVWRDITRPDEVLTKSELEWDTSTLPEGKYRVRVTASDELANPPEAALEHSLESQPVLVDNTPPVFHDLALQGRRLRGRAVDRVGPIARVEVAIDGRPEWRPVAPADGVWDSADESFDADVHALVPPGSHVVAVRAFDAAGNQVVADLTSAP